MKAARYAFASSEVGSRSIEHDLPPIYREPIGSKAKAKKEVAAYDYNVGRVKRIGGTLSRSHSFGFVTWVKSKVTDAFSDNDGVSV
ncbi:MAG: hypothetical protein ACTS6A_01340 [Candidatus Hodgkinia cicadicola]